MFVALQSMLLFILKGIVLLWNKVSFVVAVRGHVYIFINISTSLYIYIYIYVCMYVYVYICMYIYMYILYSR